MNRKKWTAWWVVALMLATASSPGIAQEGPGGPAGPAEVRRLLDAYIAMQAQDALRLSEAQYPPFVARLRTMQEVRNRNERARVRLLIELDSLSRAQPSETRDAQIRERLKTLDDLETSAASELRAARQDLMELLDLGQRARLRMFEEEMERRQLELLQRARAGARGRGSEGGRPQGR